MLRALLLTVTALGVAASPAAAARVSLEYEPPIPGVPPEPAYELSVDGGAERNLLTVTRNEIGFLVRDTGFPLTAGDGCQRNGDGTVGCATPEVATHYAVFVNAGAGNDVVNARELSGIEEVTVRGGTGSDTVGGSPGDDLLVGGSGRDWITAGAGDDRLQGGSGQDLLGGGPGFDVVTYKDHRRPIVVDLARGVGGPKDAPDTIGTIESVVGGRADDHLRGDNNVNQLQGGGGDDLLEGLGSGDILSATRVRGGGGPDRLDGRAIACGAGRDDIVRFKYAAMGPYARDCERVLTFFFALSAHAKRRGADAYRFTAWCAAGICRSKVTLHDKDGPFGTGSFAIDASDKVERSQRVRVPLERRPKGRRLEVRVRSDEGFRYRFFVRRPR